MYYLFFILVVIHIYALTSKAEEAEVEQFYEDLRRRQWHPTPVLLPEASHGQRSLVGYSCKELDTTERLHSLTHSFPYNEKDIFFGC